MGIPPGSIIMCLCMYRSTYRPPKTKAMHFRNVRKPQSNVTLHIGSKPLEYCHQYKYLGFWINEHLNMHEY